jgi:SAM-dependent methyltransferase
MVHALSEIHRVLKPGGILIDLRPVEENWSVEVVSSAGYQAAGRLSDLPIGVADDTAAFNAMNEVQSLGWFSKEKESSFSFFYYWDTPSEMKEYIDEEWEDFEKMDEVLYRKASSLWASANADARVRVRVKMWIASWRKIQEGIS